MSDEPGDPAADGDAIERAITRLVQEAPALDPGVVGELVARLRAVGSPLALSIARVVELVAAGRVDPGISLPHLAMACGTLAGGLAGRLGERELEAARYEIDTLLPLPGAPPPVLAAPDVAVDRLTVSRGPRPRP